MLRLSSVLLAALLLGGCKLTVLDPSGDIASQQGDLIVYSTILMLIVVVPVLALTAFFAFHYRDSNKRASYAPDWDHSISLEIVVWSVPLAIISCLAGLTWVATHRLDPYEPLTRISESQSIDESVAPLRVQVVALDWKWLFIYPEYGVASVNEAAAIVDRPIQFELTSTTVMNSFAIPALAGQIYAMAGMETELNAVINEPGTYDGFSANYSGAGFSQMRFKFHGLDDNAFDDWVTVLRDADEALGREAFVALEDQSVDHPVTYYSEVEEGLWRRIVNLCVGDDALCLDDMMVVDALGGGGLAGLYNRDMFRGMCSATDTRALYYMLKSTMPQESEDIIAALDLAPEDWIAAPLASPVPPAASLAPHSEGR
ncbi:MAG: ubiquinol oxidase subunit II [Pseudomonadota bacterium]